MRLLAFWAATTLLTAATSVLLEFFANPTTGLLTHLVSVKSWIPSLLAFVLVLPIATLHLLRFTHRFAGPVFRLRSELRRLGDGEQRPPLKLRTNDYWQDIASDFNRVADRLHALEQQVNEERVPEHEEGAAR